MFRLLFCGIVIFSLSPFLKATSLSDDSIVDTCDEDSNCNASKILFQRAKLVDKSLSDGQGLTGRHQHPPTQTGFAKVAPRFPVESLVPTVPRLSNDAETDPEDPMRRRKKSVHRPGTFRIRTHSNAEPAHTKRRTTKKGLVVSCRRGAAAPLNEFGYESVKTCCCVEDMEVFITRLIGFVHNGTMGICLGSGLHGFAQWFYCDTDAVTGLAGLGMVELLDEIGPNGSAINGPCPWIGVPGHCPPRKNCLDFPGSQQPPCKHCTPTTTTTTVVHCPVDSWNDPMFIKCSGWGDPHFRHSFFRSKKFNFMGIGIFVLAKTNDGCFEIQAFQSQYRNSKRASSILGFAVKLDCSNTTVYIGPNSSEWRGPLVSTGGVLPQSMSSGLPRDRIGMNVLTRDKCARLNARLRPMKRKGLPGYIYNFFLVINRDFKAAEGVCGKAAPHQQVPSDKILFTRQQISELCALSIGQSRRPPHCLQPIVQKGNEASEVGPTPAEACSSSGISLVLAESKCKDIQNPEMVDDCIVDYCLSDADETVVVNALEEEFVQSQDPVNSTCYEMLAFGTKCAGSTGISSSAECKLASEKTSISGLFENVRLTDLPAGCSHGPSGNGLDRRRFVRWNSLANAKASSNAAPFCKKVAQCYVNMGFGSASCGLGHQLSTANECEVAGERLGVKDQFQHVTNNSIPGGCVQLPKSPSQRRRYLVWNSVSIAATVPSYVEASPLCVLTPTSPLLRMVGKGDKPYVDHKPRFHFLPGGLQADPVIIAGPPTWNGKKTAVVRVQRASNYFHMWLGEPKCAPKSPDPDIHESVSFAVLETGKTTDHVVGTVTVGKNDVTVPVRDIGTYPFVFTKSQSGYKNHGIAAGYIMSRVQRSKDSFKVRIQADEHSNASPLEDEDIGYWAVRTDCTSANCGCSTKDHKSCMVKHGLVTIGGNRYTYEMGLVYTKRGTRLWTTVNFEKASFATQPSILASMQTFNGKNPGNVRVTNVALTGFDVYIDEDMCNDPETFHIQEWVAYYAFARAS